MTKPVATIDQMVHALRSNWPNWNDEGEYRDWSNQSTVSYSLLTTPVPLMGNAPMTPVMASYARYAFEAWDDVVALNIVEGGGDIHFMHHDADYSVTTEDEEYFGTHLTHADIRITNVSPHYDDNSDYFLGSRVIQTHLHEMGHALGLTHPADYNGGNPNYDDDARWAQDTRKYTVMSYFNAHEDGSGTDHTGVDDQRIYASTPLLYDIAAMQRIYGADMTTRTGDTVYGFNSNAGKWIDGIYFDPFSFDQRPDAVFCIWDAAGIDTLDASGFWGDQSINLSQGGFSSIGALTDNVSIAFGAVIENAIGGYGWDVIRGNSANNRLSGGEGNDTLFGGEGADTLFGGEGNDSLYGYSDLTAEEFSSWADLLHGDAGHDFMSGGNGLDTMWGGTGYDIMLGGRGIDTMHGESGNDQLSGGDDDDKLYGGYGNDILEGEAART